jgi:hypothetical protein
MGIQMEYRDTNIMIVVKGFVQKEDLLNYEKLFSMRTYIEDKPYKI